MKTPNNIQSMNYHSNVRLTFQGRESLFKAVTEEEWTLKKAAAYFRVSEATAAKWAGRSEVDRP